MPAAVLGLLFEDTFERLLSDPRRVAFSLVATAVVLVGAEWLAGGLPSLGGRRRLARPLHTDVSTRQAVGIGLAQAVALLPGVSRSGSTLATGLALGRPARCRAVLVPPRHPGHRGRERPRAAEVTADGIGTAELVGFAAALVTGFAVSLLLRYLRRYTYLPFAAYCAVAAVVGWSVLG